MCNFSIVTLFAALAALGVLAPAAAAPSPAALKAEAPEGAVVKVWGDRYGYGYRNGYRNGYGGGSYYNGYGRRSYRDYDNGG
jgi:hypothetical protein